MLLVLRFTTGRSEDQANLSPTCDRPGTRLVAPGTVQRTCVLSCKPLSNASCLNPVYRSEAAPRTSYSAEGASGYLYETRDGCADMPGGSAHRTIATPYLWCYHLVFWPAEEGGTTTPGNLVLLALGSLSATCLGSVSIQTTSGFLFSQ